jgi:hypothetical protein
MAVDVPSDFVCRVCGERHALTLSYSYKYPHAVGPIPKDDVDARVVMTKDQCVIDGTAFYLRGRFAVPVHGVEEPFIWGVWAEVSPKNFLRQQELWKTEGRETEPLFPGYLNNELPVYGDTLEMKLEIQTRPVGWRPHFFPKDQAHPLAVEQREGISLERVREIAVWMQHGVM